MRVANRLLESTARPFPIQGSEVFTTASIGVALGSTDQTAEDLLRDADTAMYRAKSQGRAQSVLFDTHMHARAVERLEIETDLRRGLENDELHVDYQPIVDLDTGAVTRLEALARWQHPQRGPIAPLVFVPIAEESNLIFELGDFVLREACQQLAAWRDGAAPKLTAAVNISPRQFATPGFAALITATLRSFDLPPSALSLEVTETALMSDDPVVSETVAMLAEAGTELSIDDFGTGYSALSYLREFPVSAPKIDQSFVANMPFHTESREIVRVVIALAKALGVEVVAEGVETDEQLAMLRAFGCNSAQGFLFARPVPTDEVIPLLTMPAATLAS